MSKTIAPVKNKGGRPPADTSPVTVRFHASALDAIEAARRDFPEIPTRPELVRIAVQDWLRGKGYLK